MYVHKLLCNAIENGRLLHEWIKFLSEVSEGWEDKRHKSWGATGAFWDRTHLSMENFFNY